MSRTADRLTGRAAPAAPLPYSTRPFGTTRAEAAAIAAAAAAAQENYPKPTVAGDPNPSLQAGGRSEGATAGGSTNLTTSSAPSPTSSGSQLP